jgi:hypothetical protein
MAVAAVNSDQAVITTRKRRRGPKRSAAQAECRSLALSRLELRGFG